MKFYTKKGDDGSTGLIGEGRIRKYDPRLEAIGNFDEACAALGLCRSFSTSGRVQEVALLLQKQLHLLMGEIASQDKHQVLSNGIDESHTKWVENIIEEFTSQIEMPKEFIVAGDTKSGAFFALARTTIRRAERKLTELYDHELVKNKHLLGFVNRLSSLLFVLELYENSISGKGSQTLVK